MTLPDPKLAAAALRDAAGTIRQLQEKVASQESELNTLRTEKRITKIAEKMVHKGAITSEQLNNQIENLKTAAANGKLDVIEAAVDLDGIDSWAKTASLGEPTPTNDAANQLHSYLLRSPQ